MVNVLALPAKKEKWLLVAAKNNRNDLLWACRFDEDKT